MGVLRWRPLLDSQIAVSSAQPLSKLDLEILTALRLAVHQLRWLSRIPARAAINESVELVKRARKRSAAPFVNAVLRKLLVGVSQAENPQHAIGGASSETLAASSAHPLWLVERWIEAYGIDSALRICQQDQSVPVTAIRLRRPEAEEQLRTEGIELAPGAFLASARRVEHGDITKTATLRAGLCVIQDEASQLVAALVGHGADILDCCAAPGGKTAAIADRNPNAKIAAVELHSHRARLLRNLLGGADAGAGNVFVVTADARNLPFAAQFECVLADVPCSGTGTLSRNPEIKWRLKPEDLADLQVRQLAILRSAMNQVSAGGRLIYSTCSLEREENEDAIEHILAEELVVPWDRLPHRTCAPSTAGRINLARHFFSHPRPLPAHTAWRPPVRRLLRRDPGKNLDQSCIAVSPQGLSSRAKRQIWVLVGGNADSASRNQYPSFRSR